MTTNYFVNKRLLYLLFCLIFIQNAFVISVAGGTVKWYELIGIICLLYLVFCTKKIILDLPTLYFFIIFIVSPIVSDFFSLLQKPFSSEIYELYYRRFPNAVHSMRCNYYFSTFYSLILSFSCFAILYYVIHSDNLYKNYKKVFRLFVYTATVISFYSFYQFAGITFLGLPDLVPSFLDGRNFKGYLGNHRVGGFSIEPGTYVIIQSVAIIYIFVENGIFKRKERRILLLINTISLLLTLSSSMIVTFGIFLLYFIIFEKSYRRKIFFSLILTVLVVLVFIYSDLPIMQILKYAFVTKAQNFIKVPNNTLDSGAMRAFTKYLGYRIFKSSPLFGCGFGNSFFFMPLYENSMGIIAWGERLNASSTPQNNVAKIMAEQGLLGIIPFLCFYIYALKSFFSCKTDSIMLTHLLVTAFILGINFVAAVFSTNLFIWLNIGLGLNYFLHKYR